MAPIILTHRPLVTPVRAVLAVASAAIASSVFLVFGVGYAESAASSVEVACAEQAAVGTGMFSGLDIGDSSCVSSEIGSAAYILSSRGLPDDSRVCAHRAPSQ